MRKSCSRLRLEGFVCSRHERANRNRKHACAIEFDLTNFLAML